MFSHIYLTVMKLFVVRHAATEANEKKIINGQYDDVLSSNGRKEIPALIEQLKDYEFDAIYSSPLKRAMETAMPIAESYNVEINIDRRLIEVGMGSFTRLPYEATVEVFGKNSRDLLSTYTYDLTAYGGESAEQVRHRVDSFIQELRLKKHKSVLIVTHGGTLRWIYFLCSGKKVQGFPNLSVHQFSI